MARFSLVCALALACNGEPGEQPGSVNPTTVTAADLGEGLQGVARVSEGGGGSLAAVDNRDALGDDEARFLNMPDRPQETAAGGGESAGMSPLYEQSLACTSRKCANTSAPAPVTHTAAPAAPVALSVTELRLTQT